MTLNKLETTVLFQSESFVHEVISHIIKRYNIYYFNFRRLYRDGTHISFSNYCKWMECYYSHFYNTAHFNRSSETYTTGNLLWAGLDNQEMFSVVKEQFNMAHGISLVYQYRDYCEISYFATTQENNQVVNFYLNNLDLLNGIIYLFKDKANGLIKKAEKIDRLVLPHCINKESETIVSLPNLETPLLSQELDIKRFYLPIGTNDIYLTKKEFQCVLQLSKGKSSKEGARNLDIAQRTFESYIDAVKNKLGVAMKSDMLAKLRNLQVIN